MIFSKPKSGPSLPETIYIEALDTDVRLRTHPQAKRYVLRQDVRQGGFVLTCPPRSSMRYAEKFLNDHIEWMKRHWVEADPLVPFTDGCEFSFFGNMLLIENDPTRLRGLPHVTADGRLVVPGMAENLHRKVCDFLRSEFRDRISAMAHEKSGQIRKKIQRIRIADQSTRWGSCSTTGTLSFSFRLAFAPMWVLDYIAAHEVAHMRHMDHSPKFWSLCDELCDGAHMTRAKQWLKTRDDLFMRYRLS